jgi:RNA polymerase sigma-70 factor, ECF subfamily
MSRLLHLYVERFNRRDWDGLRELISADARLLVADRFAGPLANAPYFRRYELMSTPWQLTVGDVDGELAIVGLREVNGEWTIHSIARVETAGSAVTDVVDYLHCPWVLRAANSVSSMR